MPDRDIEALVRRDIATGLAGQSDVQNENPMPAIIAPLAGFDGKGEFPGVKVAAVEGKRGRVAVEWTYRGRHVGNLGGILGTGKVLTVEGVTIVEQRDGEAPRFKRYVDWAGAMSQLGVTASFRPSFNALSDIPAFGEPRPDEEIPG
jgi:hypothetical protein